MDHFATGLFRPALIALSILLCVGSHVRTADAATLTVGTFESGNCYPFLCNDSGISSGQSLEYQQVYASSAFSGPVSITALTFFFASEFGGSSLVLDGSYKVSLSTTSAPISGLSSTAANNIGPDNTLFATFVVSSHNVDSNPSFTITGVPFTYDPGKGNLLIDFVVTNQDNVPNGTGNGYDQADDSGTQTSRLYAFDSSGVGTADSIGLVTEFTYTGVTPIPPSGAGIELQDYFSNANTTGGQGFVNITSPFEGNQTATNPVVQEGEMCAMIYVLNTDQAVEACCGCPITADGLLTLSISGNLAPNPVASGRILHDGSIRILSTAINSAITGLTLPRGVNCDAVTGACCDPTAGGGAKPLVPQLELAAWANHVQNTQITEAVFQTTPAAEATGDLTNLPSACAFAIEAGSGQGVCTCGTGGFGIE